MELEQAVAGLYRTFSSYRMPEHVDMSPYRDPEKAIGALRRKPLRELNAEDLNYYAATAITTVGDENLFKYALPRLLELVNKGDMLTDSEIVMGKLSVGSWRGWPDEEQEVVSEFMMAWWLDTLKNDPTHVSVDSVLVSFAQAGENLSAYLNWWDMHPSPTATDQLAVYIVELWDGEAGELNLNNAFLEGHPAQVQQIRSWLLRPAILQRLEQGQLSALERGVDDEQYAHYAWAIEILRILLPQGAP
ncbi:hypothetical protein [Deinococcus altitudinis]|uniref:hypothetical protein n=1 Tax=Deinococcus altitudinis TaxID=468914 RepID=UPI0038918EC1